MGFLNKYMILGLMVMGVSTLTYAQDSRIKIAQMEKDVQAQEISVETGRKDLAEKTKEIQKIKKSNGSRLVSNILLQKKLREAQVVSKNLEASIKKLTLMTQNLQKERSGLMNEIDSQIKQLTSSKDPHQLTQLQQLQQLIVEKDQLLAHQQKTVINVPNFNLSSIGDEKEDLIEKLHVVEDLQKSMVQKIALLENELSEQKSREFLRSEISHFIDEETFFGEQSFISSGLNRKENSKNLAALALKKDASATNNTNTPTDQPASPTEPTTPPTDGSAPTSGADATSNTAETTADLTSMVIAQPTSESTSFQQPQEMGMFDTLRDQVQESIRDTNPKAAAKKSDLAAAKTKDKKVSHKSKRGALEQNLALSQKILSDLDILRQNLTQQIHTLD